MVASILFQYWQLCQTSTAIPRTLLSPMYTSVMPLPDMWRDWAAEKIFPPFPESYPSRKR